MSRSIVLLVALSAVNHSSAQTSFKNRDTLYYQNRGSIYKLSQKQFTATIDFIDAAINSINSFYKANRHNMVLHNQVFINENSWLAIQAETVAN